MRILGSVALLLTGSAVLVLFAVPVGWLDRQHLLPGTIGMLLVVLLAPVIIAWYHAGFYFLLTVTGCELALVSLKPEVKRARVEAMAAVGVCALAFLYLYLAARFNFH
ncbi:MAG TPA: hypothetical protein VJX69_16640 [Terriglobales bacterium]|nr:hypothetical protein [Terriglobales bacterium]